MSPHQAKQAIRVASIPADEIVIAGGHHSPGLPQCFRVSEAGALCGNFAGASPYWMSKILDILPVVLVCSPSLANFLRNGSSNGYALRGAEVFSPLGDLKALY